MFPASSETDTEPPPPHIYSTLIIVFFPDYIRRDIVSGASYEMFVSRPQLYRTYTII